MAWFRCIDSTGGGGGEVVIVPIPVTSQMVTTSSTLGTNFEGYRAFDGQSCNLSNMQGGWLAGDSDSTPTLTVNFGEVKRLGRIAIETANNSNPDTTRDVYIEGSNDGTTWENILTSGNTTSLVFEVGKYREYSFDLNERTYQYFRIRGTEKFYGGSYQYACTFSEITIYDKSSGSGDGFTPIPLINDAVWIATDATRRTKTPIDANNYIETSGNTATLHRNNSSYGLVVRLPDLQANHTYLFGFDSITNSDNTLYIGQVTSLTSTTMTDTRIMTADNRNMALKITPSTSGDYSVMIWIGNTNDIVLVNPYLIDLEDSGSGSCFTPILTEGLISTDSAPTEAFYDKDGSSYKYLAVKIWMVQNEQTKPWAVALVPTSTIPEGGYKTYDVMLHDDEGASIVSSFRFAVSKTSIKVITYSTRLWYYCYADVTGIPNNLF